MGRSSSIVLRAYWEEDRNNWPDDWPSDIGVICLWRDGLVKAIEPFNSAEKARDFISRAAKKFLRSDEAYACYPEIEGLNFCNLSVRDDAVISEGLRSYLESNPDEVEKVADFSVNFDYAISEGIDLRKLGLAPADDSGDKRQDLPAGYSLFNGIDAVTEAFEGATVVLAEGKHDEIHVPGFDKVFKISIETVLSNQEGQSIAFRVDQLLENDVPPGLILLPEGCLGQPKNGKTTKVDLRISRSGDYLFVSPIMHTRKLVLEAKTSAPAKSRKPAWKAFAWLVLMVLALCAAVTLFGAMITVAEQEVRSADNFSNLGALMFDEQGNAPKAQNPNMLDSFQAGLSATLAKVTNMISAYR